MANGNNENDQFRSIYGSITKGHPADLAWYEEGKQRGNYILIRTSNSYYLIEQENASIFEKLEAQNENVNELISDDRLILSFPLTLEKKFGDNMGPSDNMYGWFVEKIEETALSDTHGSPVKAIEYEINMRTLPDHVFIHYADGIGITRYIYGHHGTVSDVDVKLIDWHLEK